MDKNAEILYEYIKAIMLDHESAELDLSKLDADFRDVGDSLISLHENYTRKLKEHEDFLKKDNALYRAQMAQKQLENLAYHDAMTGFYNRRYFMEMMKQAREVQQKFCLCFVDIDGLKFVNDHFGHTEGDDYIRLIGGRIHDRLRLSDVFARLGGDEFGIILRGTNAEMGKKILQGIYDALRASSNKEYEVGFSFGVIEVEPGDTTPTQELMQRVDVEMYQCKKCHHEVNRNIRSSEGMH